MAYVAREARQLLLDTVAEATNELGRALGALGAAYETVDDATADRLEDELFRPVQAAYGRARKAHAGFAERHGLPARAFELGSASGPPSQGIRGYLDQALEAVDEADLILSELQDSMMPVEIGDAELRTGLADGRGLVADVQGRARELVRTLGR